MFRIFTIVAALLLFTGSAVGAPDPAYVKEAETDAPKSADHALTGRYEGSFILGQTVKAFDELTLPSGVSEGETWDSKKKFTAIQTAQGKVTRTLYVSPVGRSSLEIFQNFRAQLAAKGFTPVFECAKEKCGASFFALKYRWDNKEAQPLAQGYNQVRGLLIGAAFDAVIDVRYALMKKTAPEGDTFAAVYAAVNRGGSMGSYSEVLNDRAGALVEVVEPKPMEQKMVVLSAADINKDVLAEGRAVFYGVFFDTDKADIKAESKPQLDEMAKFLKDNPAVKVFIAGHTDNQGKLDHNMTLSQNRAAAVMKALTTTYAIPATRLTAKGLGPLAPLASNRTDPGRAKNRRVEMVEQ